MRTLLMCLMILVPFLGAFSALAGDGKTDDLEKKLTTGIPNPKGNDTLKSGKVVTHPSGSKFRLPAGWSVKESPSGLQLLPPNAGQDELYAVTMTPCGTATDPMSAEVIAGLNQMVAGMAPTASRVGAPKPMPAGIGKGILAVYGADYQGTGYQLRAYVTLFKGNAIIVAGLGPKPKVLQRDQALREIFASLGWGEGETDKKIVGNWLYYNYTKTSKFNDIQGGNELQIRLALKTDGTFVGDFQRDSSFSGAVGWADRDGKGWKGRWTAGQGQIILHFEDATTMSFNYRLVGNSLFVRPSAGGDEYEFKRQ